MFSEISKQIANMKREETQAEQTDVMYGTQDV